MEVDRFCFLCVIGELHGIDLDLSPCFDTLIFVTQWDLYLKTWAARDLLNAIGWFARYSFKLSATGLLADWIYHKVQEIDQGHTASYEQTGHKLMKGAMVSHRVSLLDYMLKSFKSFVLSIFYIQEHNIYILSIWSPKIFIRHFLPDNLVQRVEDSSVRSLWIEAGIIQKRIWACAPRILFAKISYHISHPSCGMEGFVIPDHEDPKR